MSDTRVASATQVMEMAREGKKHNLNRQLDVKLLRATLDPNKVAVISILLFGHNMDDNRRPLHHRVQGLLPVKGQSEPLEVIFDVLGEQYDKLTKAQTLVDSTSK